MAGALLTVFLPAASGWADPTICTSHSASPLYFSPNGDKVQDATTISYILAQSARVKLTIENSASQTVRTLVNTSLAAQATPYRSVFNGKSQTGASLPDGWYHYVLTCTNGSGTQTLTRNVVIDRVPPALGAVTVWPSSFWPNGDGFRDTSSARYTLGQKTLVGMRVTTSGGTTVRWIGSVWQPAGSGLRTWDGKNASGAAVPYGYYRMLLAARDSAGNATRKTLSVLVAPFGDIMRVGDAFRSPVLSLVSHRVLASHGDGWFTGRDDSTFGPYSAMRRGDLAVALVKSFGWQNETPTVTFSDLPTSSSLYKYASIAAKHGVVPYATSTRTFAASTQTSAMTAMVGIVKGMGLAQLAANIRAQDTATPSYIGYSVLAGDMGLRYRYTGIFPAGAYNRREMAFSLDKRLHLASYKIDQMRALFGSVAAKPIVQSAKQRAITNAARQLIGYPYVWGGESFAEGGFDCSGFTYYVYRSKLGYDIQRTSASAGADSRYPRITRIGYLKPGDLVFFLAAGGSYINHMGLYLGNGYFIHSTRSRGGVSIDRFDSANDSYWVGQFWGGRRIIPVIRLTGVRLSASTIRRSGTPSSTRLYYTISKYARCTVKVYDGTTVVRTLLSSTQSAGSHSVLWNGRNAAGNVVAAKRYRISISVRDAEGNVKAASLAVTVI